MKLKNMPKNMIVSADIDGLTSAALLQKHLDFNIVGFFTTSSIHLSQENIDMSKCTFVDIEIIKKGYNSIGNHQVFSHHSLYDIYNDRIKNILNPNIERKKSHNKNNGKDKYPGATCHYICEILVREKVVKSCIDIKNKEMCSVMARADGFINTSFNGRYQENMLEWSNYFGDGDFSKFLKYCLNLNGYKKGEIERFFVKKFGNSRYYNRKTKVIDEDIINKDLSTINSIFDSSLNPFNLKDKKIIYNENHKPQKSLTLNTFNTKNVISCCVSSGDKMDFSCDNDNVF